MKLHLVRHPQPMVEPGLCYGATDVAISNHELDRVLAALRVAKLPGTLPGYSSPLRRCADLARRLQPRSLHLDARLAEMDFGVWEMRSWSTIPRADVDAWAADLLAYRCGGAENLLGMARRVRAFLDDLLRTAEPESLVICHAGTIRLLTAMRTGLPLEQAALQAASTPHHIGYGELIVLKY